MELILWIIALVVGVYGGYRIFNGDILWGIVLILIALLIGPGGVSIFM